MKYAVLSLLLWLPFAALGQTSATATHDLLEKLMPEGNPRSVRKLSESERVQAIQRLRKAQHGAKGKVAQEIAFLLALFGTDYETNRDYLTDTLRGCNSPTVKNECDEDVGDYLIALYEHGHKELLRPLMLEGSRNSNQVALSEMLGSFYSDVLVKNPQEFLDVLEGQPIRVQKKLCESAGISDGGGMAPKDVQTVRKKLRGIGTELASRCLKSVEDVNKSQ